MITVCSDCYQKTRDQTDSFLYHEATDATPCPACGATVSAQELTYQYLKDHHELLEVSQR